MEDNKSVFKNLTGKSTRKRTLGKPRRRWEDSIRTDHKEIGVNSMNTTHKTDYWRAFVNSAKNFRVP